MSNTSAQRRNVLDWTYYDQRTVATAAVVQSFFNVVAANKQLGNLPQAGRIPEGNSFEVRSIRTVVRSRLVAAILTERDVEEVMYGYGNFQLNGVSQWEGHLFNTPSGSGIVSVNAAVTVSLANNGLQSWTNRRILEVPILITNETLQMDVSWFTAITLATSAVVTMCLDGILRRKLS